MSFRISPVWWPVLAVASPVVVPWLLVRNRRFQQGRARATGLNEERISHAEPLELPDLDFLELTVLVEWKAEEGFLGDAGVSYLFRTELGSMLYDVGLAQLVQPSLTTLQSLASIWIRWRPWPSHTFTRTT